MPLLEQVEEVQLVQASTLEEEFEWRGSDEDVQQWEASIKGEKIDTVVPFSFALKLEESCHLWLNVNYRQEGKVQLTLQGPTVAGDDLDRVKKYLDERYEQALREGFDNVVFDVFTALQAYLTEQPVKISQPEPKQPEKMEINSALLVVNRHVKMSRSILWTHHLKAPSKKRDMMAWCSELSLWGLVKSGYPGYLCFEGEEKDVHEMIRRIKALQWHAIMVKTEEPYIYEASDACSNSGEIRDEAVRHCLLSFNQVEQQQQQQYQHYQQKQQPHAGSKLRTTMIEVESGKELVERLKAAMVPEEEYRLALNLRRV